MLEYFHTAEFIAAMVLTLAPLLGK